MGKTFVRLLLIIFPILYSTLIWMQSSYFDPGFIYILSSTIRIEILVLVGIGFELFHFFQFGILYLLIIFAFLSFGKFTKGMEILAVIISCSYGLLDEIHQMYVPFRSFSMGDLIKDAVGVLVISFIIHGSYFKKSRTKLGVLLRRIEDLSKKDGHNISL